MKIKSKMIKARMTTLYSNEWDDCIINANLITYGRVFSKRDGKPYNYKCRVMGDTLHEFIVNVNDLKIGEGD